MERNLGIMVTAVVAVIVVLSYYIFTLPVSVGMQPQHFVATYFLLFLIISMTIRDVDVDYETLKEKLNLVNDEM